MDLFDNDLPNYFVNTGILVLSMVSSLYLSFVLSKNKTNYAKIMNLCVISDSILIFAIYVIWIKTKITNSDNHLTCKIQRYLIFFTSQKICTNIPSLSKSLYFSMQTFSILCHFIATFETTFTLKNPISPVKKRIRIYLFILIFLFIFSFLLVFIFDVPEKNLNSIKIEKVIFSRNFAIYINLILFNLLLFSWIISVFFLCNRFCTRNTIATDLRKKYVTNQITYFILYFAILSLYYFNQFLSFISTEFFHQKISLFLHFSQVLLMFFYRATFTNFYSILKINSNKSIRETLFNENSEDNSGDNRGALSEEIAQTVNFEFLSCIVHGLSDIFKKIDKIKPKVKLSNKSKSINKNMKKFKSIREHSIFYVKENDSDIINGIRIHSSLDSSFFSINSFDSINSKLSRIDATIIEYNPKVFRIIREQDKLTTEELLYSLDPKLNMTNIVRIKESNGKSGSFFFYTHNNKFLIKTMTNSELNTFLGKFIERYHEHLMNSETLLTKIYGVYTIKLNQVSKLNILFMQNLNFFPKSHIKRIFDLKGSTVERFTANIQNTDKFMALKDMDFLWMTKIDPGLISFTKDDSIELLSILQNDLLILRDVNIMDYSLLLIVIHYPNNLDTEYENILQTQNHERYAKRIYVSKDNKYLYCVGLIDYLQKFDMSKFLENKYKSLLHGKEIKNVSAVDPMIYASRMLDFAKKYIFN